MSYTELVNKIQIFLGEVCGVFQEKRGRQTFKTFVLEKIQALVIRFFSILSSSKQISRFLNYKKGEHGFFIRDSYYITHNAGLMSCASTTLSDIIRSDRKVVRIRSTLGMSLYKKQLLVDNWTKFFETPHRDSLPGEKAISAPIQEKIHDWWSRDYSSLKVDLVRESVHAYFKPSSQVQTKLETFITAYGIKLDSTVGVHYRATDKAIEIGTPSLKEFINQTSLEMAGLTNPQILLLTDEPMAQEAFRDYFPGKVIVVEELEAPGGSIGAHILDSKEVELRAQIFLAILLLISRCRKVVTHTGNGALWEVLFRGGAQGLLQVR